MTPEEAARGEYMLALSQALGRCSDLAATLFEERKKNAELLKIIEELKKTTPT